MLWLAPLCLSEPFRYFRPFYWASYENWCVEFASGRNLYLFSPTEWNWLFELFNGWLLFSVCSFGEKIILLRGTNIMSLLALWYPLSEDIMSRWFSSHELRLFFSLKLEREDDSTLNWQFYWEEVPSAKCNCWSEDCWTTSLSRPESVK